MDTTMAIIFRHILNFQPNNSLRLPGAPKQRLAADLVRLVMEPRREWSFQVSPGSGVAEALGDLFRLWAAIRYFYTGESTHLAIVGSLAPKSGVPWLKIVSAPAIPETIDVNGDGTLACFLPQLPRGNCRDFSQRQYHVTAELINWIARRLWNFPTLREGQFEIISRLAQDRNTLGILPTGAGKSLCFQLLAMLLPGITLVVSPLKSLMRDQFVNLCKSGISGVEFIDSSKTSEERREVLFKLRAGQLKLLYISPERLQIESFQLELADTIAAFPISLFAIDEAHCISEWGHDFRPSYLRLRHFIAQMHSPPICALTATASQYVRQDILNLLGLNLQDTITPTSMDRQELSLQVKIIGPQDDLHQVIADTIDTGIPTVLGRPLKDIHGKSAGVVFTPYAAPQGRSTRPMGAETVADFLKDRGLDCRCYHSQMPDADRIEIQDQFKDNAFPLLVATKGYGMGIDKDNIDYIVHACAPASLEAYYQEAGRAGRDGEHAHCVIIARPRQEKCVRESSAALPPCHRGWKCQYTGGEKCDYGIQAGLLAMEYPPEQETIQRFTHFLARLEECRQGEEIFRYLCPHRDSAQQQKYLYYLHVLGAVNEFKVLEYRRVDANQFDLLLQVELSGDHSLDNKYWLANKVVERIETYKDQKLNMLNTVQVYINTKTCRRRFLMQYFSDTVNYEQCNFCDNEGIGPRPTPNPAKTLGHEQALVLLRTALAEQDLALALNLAGQAQRLKIDDDAGVQAMRELEEQPHNPAALLLAGVFAARRPETESYGLRNLRGAVDYSLGEAPQHLPGIFALLAWEMPENAYLLAQNYLEQLDSTTLREIASVLDSPDQYPDVHLALLLPYLEQVNHLLHREVSK